MKGINVRELVTLYRRYANNEITYQELLKCLG